VRYLQVSVADLLTAPFNALRRGEDGFRAFRTSSVSLQIINAAFVLQSNPDKDADQNANQGTGENSHLKRVRN